MADEVPVANAPAPEAAPVAPAIDPAELASLREKAASFDRWDARFSQVRRDNAKGFAYLSGVLMGQEPGEPPADAVRAETATEVTEADVDPNIRAYVTREIERGVQAHVGAIRAQLGTLQNRAAVDDVGKQLDALKHEIKSSGGTDEDYVKAASTVERQLTQTPGLTKTPNAVLTLGLAADRSRLVAAKSAPQSAGEPVLAALRARIVNARGLPGRAQSPQTPAPQDTRTRTMDEIMEISLARARAEAQ